MDEETRELLVLADSYLSLARYRYGDRWPADMKREVEQLLGRLRVAEIKGRRR